MFKKIKHEKQILKPQYYKSLINEHKGTGCYRSFLDFSLVTLIACPVRNAGYQDKESDKWPEEIKSTNITTADCFVPCNDENFH